MQFNDFANIFLFRQLQTSSRIDQDSLSKVSTDKADDRQKDAKWEDDRTELISNARAEVQVIA